MKTKKTAFVNTLLAAVLLLSGCASTAAQETKSQDNLPGDFLSVLRLARARTEAKEWSAAVASWEKVVHLNPVTGEFWYQLGEACYYSTDYRHAIPAYEQALKLGVGFPASRVRDVARCYAMMGDKEQAVRWLDRAVAQGYRRLDLIRSDPAFESLHADPRFQQLAATVDTKSMSRDDGWRYDLQLLAREVKRRRYDPFRSITEVEFDAAVKRIHESVPRLTDMQVIIELMRLLASIRDGHTLIYGMFERPEFRRNLPIELNSFEEGWFITAADERHEDLLGAQVLKFGERTIADVLLALDPLIGRDNDVAPKVMGPMRMRTLPLLHGLGLIPNTDKVSLTVVDRQGKRRTVTLLADSEIPSRKLFDGLPPGWKSFHQMLEGQLPLYLKNQYADYWFEYLPESKTVYFQFNHVRNNEREPLSVFCDRLFKFINEQAVEKLVVDMRWNNGGDTTIVDPLIHGLIRSDKINQRGKLFVIIGRRTYSAAQNTATYIERHTRAIFAGEPTGSSPNFIGEDNPFELPYSKLMANVSDLYWQSSWPGDHRPWIAPLVYTPPTFEAYRANRDLALEAILAYRD